MYSYFCQETFQDPKAIDIDSEEFKALPPEIQHELIKDIREEKTWMSKNILPGVREATILNLSVSILLKIFVSQDYALKRRHPF